MLEIAGVHQVMLKVTMAEVVRNATRSLLSDIAIGDSAGILAGTTVDFSTLPNGAGSFQIETNNFELRLNALKQLNLARSLAEPNLTTLNGQPATFLVGGQFPVQEAVATVGAVGTSITYVPFGIQLTALTTVTDNDRIRLNLQAAITELANGNRQGQGQEPAQNSPTNPPSLSTRSFMTTVEMRESESLAIAGLIRTSLNNTSSKVPFLGDLPVIGTLFSKNTTAAQEQELILVVTPHLVSPVNYEQVQPLPGSDVFEADDLQFFLMGRTEGNIAEDYRSPVRSDLHKMKAFRHVEQKYIVGTPGHSSGRPVPAAQYPTVPSVTVPESQPLLPEGVQP
jgi:pilus assembly protein CpaC